MRQEAAKRKKTYLVKEVLFSGKIERAQTRPDTRLPQSRAGRQGPYLRSLEHLGRCSEVKDRKKLSGMDRLTDGPTDGRTKRGVESRSTQLKKKNQSGEMERGKTRNE